MINDTPILKLSRNSRWSNGVHVFEVEVVLLQQLRIHGVLPAEAIHELFRDLFNYSTPNVVTNRLMRIRKAGLIVMMQQSVYGSLSKYYYRLGERGVEVLESLGLIDNKEAETILNNLNKKNLPSSHSVHASTLANKVYIEHRRKTWDDLTHWKGSAHPLFSNPLSSLLETRPFESLIIPDWVFEHRQLFICMEIDTGTQRREVIRKKYENYLKESDRLAKLGKQPIVIFTVVDDSVDDSYSGNRERRLGSIKESSLSFGLWEEENRTKNIHFYAVSANRTVQLVNELVAETKPSLSAKQRPNLESWLKTVATVIERASQGFHVQQLSVEDVFQNRRDRALDCDAVLSLTWRQGRFTQERRLAILFAEEASVASYQLIYVNAKRVVAAAEADGIPTQLMICYRTKEEMENNTLGFELLQPIIETNIESWSAVSDSDGPPDVLHVISPFKKEWRKFHE